MSHTVQLFLPGFTPSLWEVCSSHSLSYLEASAAHRAVFAIVRRESYDFPREAAKFLGGLNSNQFDAFCSFIVSDMSAFDRRNALAWLVIFRSEGGQ